MRDFQKIIAWQKAHAFALLLQEVVDWTRFRVRPNLKAQLIGSTDSIAANIAEGSGRSTEADFAHYLDQAMSSARETQNHLLLAKGLRCIEASVATRLLSDLDEVSRVLYCYIRAIRNQKPAVDARSREPRNADTNRS